MSKEFLRGMMNSAALPPYPAYRPSGVEWLGEIPAHWEIKRLKFLAPFRYGDSLAEEAREPGDVPVYGSNGPVGTHSRSNTAGPCLIIGRKGSFGKVNWSADPCFAIDTTFFVDSLHAKADLRWLHYAIPLLKLDSLSQDSAVPGLSRAFAHEQWLPDVPLSEQRAITGYLDRATARIDALIAAKERLLDLLAEKRRALISHAVTKGLDPSAPMKDSGIAWLGEIPAHWEVKRLRHISPEQTVGVVVNPSDYFAESGMPFLLGGDVSPGSISVERAKRISEENNRLLAKSVLRAGDLVVVRVGYPGVAAVVPPELDGSNCASMLIVRRSARHLSHWLCYAFNSTLGNAQVELVQYGAAQKQFNVSHAVNFVFPVPPIREQKQLIAYLDDETARLDALAGKVRAAIERLREYRAALISAAVTGKVDVRGEGRGMMTTNEKDESNGSPRGGRIR